MICPLLNAGRPDGSDAVPCLKESCAWWIGGKGKRPGCCAMTRAVHYLAATLKVQRKEGDHEGSPAPGQ